MIDTLNNMKIDIAFAWKLFFITLTVINEKKVLCISPVI